MKLQFKINNKNVKDNEDEIIEICSQLYKKASEENKIADLETVRIIVNQFGENGYPAVDSRNQINMTEPEKVVEFCEKVDAQEVAEITILEISYLGGFVKIRFTHKETENVDVVKAITSTKMAIYKERLLEAIRRSIGIIQKKVT